MSVRPDRPTTDIIVARPRHAARRPASVRLGLASLVATIGASSIGSDARAEFDGLQYEYAIITVGDKPYHVVDVYASFSEETDRLLMVFETGVSLNTPTDVGFYNVGALLGQPLMPICADPWPDAYVIDSYVTIGREQCDALGFVALTPDAPALMLVNGDYDGPAGWYASPPIGGENTAGVDYRVRVARFSLDGQYWSSSSSIDVAWRVAWIPWGSTQTKFSNHFMHIPLNGFAGNELPLDIPGEPYWPAMGGGGVTVPPGPPAPAGPAGNGDLVWLSPGGYITGWQLTGMSLESATCLDDELAPLPPVLKPVGRGDADVDGDLDLFFISDQYHELRLLRMQDGAIDSVEELGMPPVPGPQKWDVIAIADVDDDGDSDIVWRHEDGGNGQVRVWLIEDGQVVDDELVGISPGFEFLGCGDLNGDGSDDLLWRLFGGAVVVWPMHGTLPVIPKMFGGVGLVNLAWQVEAMCDLDADGDDDIVWRNALTSQVNGWIVEGLAREYGGVIANSVSSAWHCEETVDLDGSGTGDLIWRNHISGKVNGWRMDELTKLEGATIGTLGPGSAWTPW